MNKLDIFNKTQQLSFKKSNFRVGDTVKVHQKVKEGDKERIQIFEGLVIAKKHGNQPSATFTVRKISFGVGVERVFPLFSPLINNIEVVKSAKVRRSKIYFVRTVKGKKSRLKAKALELVAAETGGDDEAIKQQELEEETAEAKEMKEESKTE